MKVTYEPLPSERVLAIDPIPRGFGFVVLEEEPLQLVDWGVVSCRKRRGSRCELVLDRMLRRYEPTVLVFEDPSDARELRQEALTAFMLSIAEILANSAVPVRLYSRGEIRESFASAGALTKEAIAQVLARRFPELVPHVPPPRKIWESEDSRMSIFDALSLAATHLSDDADRSAEAS